MRKQLSRDTVLGKDSKKVVGKNSCRIRVLFTDLFLNKTKQPILKKYRGMITLTFKSLFQDLNWSQILMFDKQPVDEQAPRSKICPLSC